MNHLHNKSDLISSLHREFFTQNLVHCSFVEHFRSVNNWKLRIHCVIWFLRIKCEIYEHGIWLAIDFSVDDFVDILCFECHTFQ